MAIIKKIVKKSAQEMADICIDTNFPPVFYANNIAVHNSTKEIGEALQKKGLHTGVYTATGAMALNKESLQSWKHEIASKILEYNSVTTQLSSYATKFLNIDQGYISYQHLSASTGRILSGNKDGANSYFLNINFQNLTKPSKALYRAIHKSNPVYHFEKYKNVPDILDYKFIIVSKDEIFYETKIKENALGVPEEIQIQKVYPLKDESGIALPNTTNCIKGFSPENNIRAAITRPSDDWLLVSIDYSSEELVLAGIMSGEPNYLEPYKKMEDIHKRTAIAVWGEKEYGPDKRDMAKTLNFGLQYGGSTYTLIYKLGIPENIADDTFNKFWKGLSVLKAYQNNLIRTTKQNLGNVYTYFGRPRRFKSKIFSESFKEVKSAERGVLNHPIQGTAGDIIRLDLVRLNDEIFSEPDALSKIRFVGTVHDELVLLLHKDHFYTLMPKLKDIMEIKFPEADISLRIESEIGTSFGHTFVFNPDQNGVYIPDVKDMG